MTPMIKMPLVPMARPACLNAAGMAKMPVPTFPLMMCIIVAAFDVKADADVALDIILRWFALRVALRWRERKIWLVLCMSQVVKD